MVGLLPLISTLERGFDTNIGEGGIELSGGESQRIAIARALISKRDVVILDEPTSHLDIETEYEIKKKLLHLFKGKTVIIATHRLHWLNDMDYILHLENGKIKDLDSLKNYKYTSKYLDLKESLIGGNYIG